MGRKPRDAELFLRRMNEMNARIAEREQRKPGAGLLAGEDPVRLQREKERREHEEQVRAREHRTRQQHSAEGWSSPKRAQQP